MATPFRLSCDHSLLTHTINYISSEHICLPIQWPAPQLPIINEMSNKTEIANPSHQLHFIVSHSPTLQQPVSWLPFINNWSNSYYSLDYILPYLTPNQFKLQAGFQLTHNTILWTYHPIRISSKKNFPSKPQVNTHHQNKNFDFQQYSLYLTSVRPIHRKHLLV